MPQKDEDVLAEISDLYVNFYTYQGTVQAIEGVDLVIRKSETLGLVGETGCGKSVTASTIMRLILSPPGKMEAGSIYFMEPPEVRAMRKKYEADAQTWFQGLAESERRKIVATYGMRFTGFKKRVKPMTSGEASKLVLPRRAPFRAVAAHMRNRASKVQKGDKVSQEALRKAYDLMGKNDAYMRRIRGRFISMIFQEPTSALNPVFTAGDQIAEVILQHRKVEMADRALKSIDREIDLMRQGKRPRKIMRKETDLKGAKVAKYKCSICDAQVRHEDPWCSNCKVEFYSALEWSTRRPVIETYKRLITFVKKNPDSKNSFISRIPIVRRYRGYLYEEAIREAVRMLEIVRIPDPKGVAYRFPYELSGGMQQRVMIAIALACNPKLLIADEPTTALDVTIQGQILKLMRDLKEVYGSSILLITHNLGVVAEMCDRVGVMYAGAMAEIGSARSIFKKPLHPYTTGLMKSVPSIQGEVEKLYTIRGSVPNLIYPPSGCRFHPRCDFAKDYCVKVKPDLAEVEEDHFVACHMASGVKGYADSGPIAR
jgi:peptide/nickel transport system ATP-binding protein